MWCISSSRNVNALVRRVVARRRQHTGREMIAPVGGAGSSPAAATLTNECVAQSGESAALIQRGPQVQILPHSQCWTDQIWARIGAADE